jgi:hypothetical protein
MHLMRKSGNQEAELARAFEDADASAKIAVVQKALSGKSTAVVATAARLAAKHGLSAVSHDLVDAMVRLSKDGDRVDPLCSARHALVEALVALGAGDPEPFVLGLAIRVGMQTQLEAHSRLRIASALGLAQSRMPELDILEHLVNLLGDRDDNVRANVVRALSQLASREAALLVRAKAVCGDENVEVVGQCFVALLDMMPVEHLDFIAEMAMKRNDQVGGLALLALSGCQHPASIAKLTEYWHRKTDAPSKQDALDAIANSRHREQAIDFLLSLVEEGSPQVAADAIMALATARYKDVARDRLKALVEERDSSTIRRAFERGFGPG